MRRAERFHPSYALAHRVLGFLSSRVYRAWSRGVEHVPREGPCLIASSHLSVVDPPMTAVAIPSRQVYFMAKKELFSIPILSCLLRSYGTFPVERGAGNPQALERAAALLGRGRVVGLYPEGTRSRDGRLGRGRLGVAQLALRTGAPVVPAAVFGTDHLLHERRMWPGGPPPGIRFGPPLRFPPEARPARARLEQVRDEIMAAIEVQLQAGVPRPPGPERG